MRKGSSPHTPEDDFAARFAATALAAAAPVMEIYSRGAVARLKPDLSPVTEADEASERIILADLAREAPDIPVVSEEAVARGDCPDIGREFILVDPLDGTREFVNGNGEFTINIALVRDGAPVCGVIYAPVQERLWLAGSAAWTAAAKPGAALPGRALWRPIHTRPPPPGGAVALISRSHRDPRSEVFLEQLPVSERRIAGSSIKFCLIAEGQADVYPRFGPTMEWDIAAGDAILRAAGGVVVGEDGRSMPYGRRAEHFRNGNFVAWGRRRRL